MITDWDSFFRENDLELKLPPFGLPTSPKSSLLALEEYEKELEYQLPDDYKSFCLNVGPGIAGRVRVFCPLDKLSNPDPRIHHHRIIKKFAEDDFIVAHKFPLSSLIFFAQDVEIDCWYGWRKDLEGDYSIYIAEEISKAPCPRKVATSFSEFVRKVCYGDAIKRMGYYKFSEDPDQCGTDEESWSDDEEREFERPPQTFTKFVADR